MINLVFYQKKCNFAQFFLLFPWMDLEIRKIGTKNEIKQFISFANNLYKDCPYFCPPLFAGEMDTFDPRKNPTLEHCEYQLFLAYRDGKVVGRVAALINHKANAHWSNLHVRFGWLDFVDDVEVSRALLDAVKAWGKERGMTAMNGPVGFTDWDHQGLLLQGYEYVAPIASLYNFPYYVHHLDAYGLKKEVDWIEYRIQTPREVPERVARLSKVVAARYHLRIDKVHSKDELQRKYGLSYMDMLDSVYQNIYNFQPMTQRQKEYYRDMYFPILNFDFVSIVVNEKNEIVGAGLGMPDISQAVRRCGGRLFPMGWYYVLKALRAKRMEIFDLLLIGVRKDYQGKGVTSMLFADMIPYFSQYGVKYIETTSMLETNYKVLSNFEPYDKVQHKRRRAYIMDI